MTAAVLRAEKLTKRFGSLEVLRGVSLALARGDVKVVIGPSGSGKSTLLRCLNHLLLPDQGKVYLEGTEVTPKNADRIRADLGFVFQDFGLFTHLTALRNVMLGLVKVRGMTKAAARDRAMAELERVGLADRRDHYPAQLSGGQQQRVAIARALAMSPKVVLFDEPTSALDPELTAEVLAVMRQLASEGITMLVVTHEMAFARDAANEIVFMEQGRVMDQGPPERFFGAGSRDLRAGQFLAGLRAL